MKSLDLNRKVTDEELKRLRENANNMNQARLAFGNLELERFRLQKNFEMLQLDVSALENELINKYGRDAVININTGEIKNNADGKN